MADPRQTDLFQEGVRLFNERQWFEAHETWETLWHTLAGERRQFVQGLIQCAVALEHVRRGNPRGALVTLERARPRLANLPAVYMGVHVRALLAQLERLLAPLRTMSPASLTPRAARGRRGRRGLMLPIDLHTAPRIELRDDPFAENVCAKP